MTNAANPARKASAVVRSGSAPVTTRPAARLAHLPLLLGDLPAEDEVQGGPDGGDRRELADLGEGRRHRGTQDVRGQLELQPEGEEPAQGKPDRGEHGGAAVPQAPDHEPHAAQSAPMKMTNAPAASTTATTISSPSRRNSATAPGALPGATA